MMNIPSIKMLINFAIDIPMNAMIFN